MAAPKIDRDDAAFSDPEAEKRARHGATTHFRVLSNGRFFDELVNLDTEIHIRISRDAMEALAIARPAMPGMPPLIAPHTIYNKLREAGVRIEPDFSALASLFEKLQSGEDPTGLVLVRGRPPRHGADGRVEMFVETHRLGGVMAADGKFDFRERGAVQSVPEGALLARILPPEKGEPGCNVLGHSLPARDGKPVSLKVGENVRVSEDRREFYAATNGMVLFHDNTLSVSSLIEVPGDVDYSTGNIRMLQGAVVVFGTIRDGFTVLAQGTIMVGGSVEDAIVEAGGDILVKRGIVMHGERTISAGGNLCAHFLENARVRADGNVVIDNDITNCEVVAGGKVVATRERGRIQGGVIRCGGGVEAAEIGSAAEVSTEIVIGVESRKLLDALREREELEKIVRRVTESLGYESPRAILLMASPEKRPVVAELLKTRMRALSRLTEIDAFLQVEQERLVAQSQSRVLVRKVIHPGVTVTIAGTTLEIRRAIRHSQIYYDAEHHKVVVEPLG